MIGADDNLNNGDVAITISIVKQLKELIPGMDLAMLSTLPEITRKKYEPYLKFYDVKIEGTPWYKPPAYKPLKKAYAAVHAFLFLSSFLIWKLLKRVGVNTPLRGNLNEYDIHIHCGTDTRTKAYGALSFYYSLYPLLLSILTRRPFVIYGETMGPFKSIVDKFAMKFFLGKASLITVREQITGDYLQAIGVNKLVNLTADPAFLLRPISAGEANKILAKEGVTGSMQPLVGITASSLIYRYAFPGVKKPRVKREIYVSMMAKIIDYITERLNATVVLFPHTLAPEDKLIHKEIYQRVKNRNRAILLGGEYDAVQIKGIIGTFKAFISCRMHAVIASTSMGVPSLAISFSHKYQGVLSPLMDPEKGIIDISQPGPEELFNELCSKIDYVWENRERITRELQEKMPEVRKRAQLNAELTRELLEELPYVEKSGK